MEESQPGKGARAAGQVVAAATGLAVGGPAGALIAAAVTDLAVEATGRAWNEITAARRNSAAAVVQLAADDLAEPPDDLVSRALSNHDQASLLADAIAAAAHTFYDRKVAALARSVANGLRDDGAKVDEARLVVRALADLEEPHVKVLLGFHVRPEQLKSAAVTTRKQWTIRSAGLSDAAIVHVLSMLEARGLVEVDDESERRLKMPHEGGLKGLPWGEGDQIWTPTEFGRVCIQYLRDYPQDPAVK